MVKNQKILLIATFLLFTNTSFAQGIPTNGLVAWYPFNGNANDESGNGYTSTITGATLTTGRLGNTNSAYNFTGTSQYIITNYPGVTGTNDRTISLWFKQTTINSGSSEWPLFNYSGFTQGSGFAAMIFPANISAQSNRTGVDIGGSYAVYDPIPTLNEWHHLVIVYSSTFGTNVLACKVYLDNVLLSTVVGSLATSIPLNTGNDSQNLTIGANPGLLSAQFLGSIDDIAVYDRLLTEPEISSLFLDGVPTITTFTPSAGNIGTSVTITGTNFSTSIANNIVFFGATKSIVTSAALTSLTVIVPVGATYEPITVLNSESGLMAESLIPYNVTYSCGATSFGAKVDFTTGSVPYNISLGDLDGDGKTDMVGSNQNSNSISVYRNTGNGAISSSSFETKIDFASGLSPNTISLADIDGDGKLDIAVTNTGSNTVSIFKNVSSNGSISSTSFEAKVDFVTGSFPVGISFSDIDYDGKPDIVVANRDSNTISVYRNTSTKGTITTNSFVAKVDFITGSYPHYISINDIDNDGKVDISVTNFNSNTVSVFRNTSNVGTVSASTFASKVDFTTGAGPMGISISDLDGDNKVDMAITNRGESTVSIFRNTSTNGTISSSSFSTKVDFLTGNYPWGISSGNLDGDGKTDLVIANHLSGSLSIFKNTSTIGTISTSSFDSKIDFPTASTPLGLAIGDLNGDQKIDIITNCVGSNVISVLGNICNTSPTDISLSSTSIFENLPIGTTVGTLSTTDAEAGTMTYSLFSGTGDSDNGSFTIVNDKLKTGASFNFETKSSYSIRMNVADNGGLTYEKQFVILVTNVVDETVPLNGLVAWYPFNGNANDESGNGGDGTVNGALLTNDRAGNTNSAYNFDGVDDYILGSSSNFPSGNRTISIWYMGNTLGESAVGKQLFGYGGGSCGTSWMMYFDYPIEAPGNLGIEGHCTAFRNVTPYPQPANNSWHLASVTYDGTNIKVYFDGTLSYTIAAAVTATNVAGKKFGIGASVVPSGDIIYTDPVWPKFNGKIDDVGVYNRALSEAEVLQLYTAVKQVQVISFGSLTAKTYGDLSFALSATSNSGLDVTYVSSDPNVATVSGNTITIKAAGTTVITATQSGNDTYGPAQSVVQTLTVNKATLTATADNKSRVYGDDNPAFTITYSGFKNSETSSVIDTAPTATTTATQLSNVGSYNIVPASGTDNNYSLTFVNGTLTITQATLTATADNNSRVYGDANPAFTIGYAGFKNNETSSVIDTAPTTTTTATQSSNVGTENIVPASGGDNNYSFSYVDGTLTITQATLTATADNKSRVYGDANPAFTVTYSGFKNSETASVIDSSPTASASATPASLVGPYTITVSGGADNNYSFSYVSGVLTIAKAPQTISFTTLNAIVETVGSFTLTGTSSSGLPVSFSSANTGNISIDGNTVTILASGSVTITAAQAGSDEYEAASSVSQTICILPAKPTITATGLDSENAVLTSSATAGNQWYRNGGILTGETATFYTVDDEGQYTVNTTIDGCAGELSDPFTVIITDLNDPEHSVRLSLFPNPARDELRIQLTGVKENETSTFTVYDLLGRVVTKLDVVGNQGTLNINQYGSGNYILHVVNKTFTRIAKFTKE